MIGREPSNLVFAVSAAIDVIVVCGAVWWATDRPPVWARLVGALVGAVALLAVKDVVLVIAGLEARWGTVHVVWLDLVIVVPLAGLVLLVRARGWALRLVAIGACLLAPVGAYASFVEPSRLVVERATVPLSADRDGTRPVRLGVMSDLQFEHVGAHERKAIATLMRQQPDVILIAGDFHQGSLKSLEEGLSDIRELLRGLHAPGGVFAVQGDAESMEKLRWMTEHTGVRVLDNDVVRERVAGRRLTIAGVPIAYRSPRAQRTARALEAAPGKGDVRILLAHRPDVVYGLRPRSRVDLVVAGHTHGGQIQLPGIGPLSIASSVPRSVGAGGLHSLDGRRLYVTRGVGVERGQAPRLRFGDAPEVSVLTLR